jgi:hypothetical protein
MQWGFIKLQDLSPLSRAEDWNSSHRDMEIGVRDKQELGRGCGVWALLHQQKAALSRTMSGLILCFYFKFSIYLLYIMISYIPFILFKYNQHHLPLLIFRNWKKSYLKTLEIKHSKTIDVVLLWKTKPIIFK